MRSSANSTDEKSTEAKSAADGVLSQALRLASHSVGGLGAVFVAHDEKVKKYSSNPQVNALLSRGEFDEALLVKPADDSPIIAEKKLSHDGMSYEVKLISIVRNSAKYSLAFIFESASKGPFLDANQLEFFVESLCQMYAGLAEAEQTAFERDCLVEATRCSSETVLIYGPDDRLVLAIEGRSKYHNFEKIFVKGRTMEDIHYDVARDVLLIPEDKIKPWVKNRVSRNPNAPIEFERDATMGRGLVRDNYTENGLRITTYLDLPTVLGESRLYKETLRQVKTNAEALERAHAEITQQAMTDYLTGLKNRRAFDAEIARMTSETTSDTDFWLLHIDLDHFKAVNDTLGHQAGDQVLRHVAQVLEGCLATSDFAARLGGDEFAVITHGPKTGAELADIILKSLSAPVIIADHKMTIGASIGISPWEASRPITTHRLLNDADTALYQAKELGRCRFVEIDDALRTSLNMRRQITENLQRANWNEEFVPAYQPQIDVLSGELDGVEALVRWQPDGGEPRTPDRFLAQAERLGLLAQIDRTILRKIAQDDENWRAQGIELPQISINVSSERLRDPSLIPDIKALPALHGRLVLEILESVFSDKLDEDTQDILFQLRELGVGIHVDDFGMGHSSLMGLLQIRPDRLKIPREFVSPLPESKAHKDVAQFVCGIAGALNINVIAEGVETFEQRDFLSHIGCRVFQGYLFSRPITADALPEFVRTSSASVMPLHNGVVRRTSG